MDRLAIWDNDKIERKIALCFDRGSKSSSATEKYKFPLSDILLHFYKDAIVSEDFYSIEELKIMFKKYYREHEKVKFSVNQLIQEGWFSIVFGRWTSAFSNMFAWEKVEDISDEVFPDAAVIRFLIWLQREEKIHSYNIEILNPEEKLAGWRNLCPEVPELQWFLDKHFLVQLGDKYYAYNGYSWNLEIYRTLAKLWLVCKDTEREKWLNITRNLQGTSKILDNLEDNERKELLQFLLMEIFFECPIPSWEEENVFYQKIRMLEVPDYAKNPEKYGHSELRTGNRIIDGLRYNQYGFEYYIRLGRGVSDYSLILDSMLSYLNHCSDKEDKKFSSYLNAYDKISALYWTVKLEPEGIYELLSRKGTMYLGFRYLISDFGESIADQDAYIQNIVYVMQRILKEGSSKKDFLSGEEIGICLFYLQKHVQRKNIKYKILLTAMLELLAELEYLEILGEGLCNYFQELLHIKDAVDWVAGYELILSYVNHWLKAMPDIETKKYFFTMSYLVWYGYQMAFDGESDYITYLNEGYFTSEICCFIYRTYIKKKCIAERRKLLLPNEQLKYSDGKNQVYYFYRLLLRILFYIYEKEEKDTVVKSILLEALEQVLLKKRESEERQIFDYTYMQIFSVKEIMRKCIGILRYEIEETSNLVEQMLNAEVPELLVYYEAAVDKQLKEEFLNKINQKAQKDSLSVFDNEHALDLVLDYEIESLYPAVAYTLQQKFEHWGTKCLRHDYYQKALHQKWRLCYCKKQYSEILAGDYSFLKAIVYMEVEEYQNFQKTDDIWKEMIKQRKQNDYGSAVFLNYFLLLNRELEKENLEAKMKNDIIMQIEWLMNIIETEEISRWCNDDLDSYGWLVVQSKKIQGKDYLHDLYLYKKKYQLSLTVDSFLEYKDVTNKLPIASEQKTYKDDDLVNALCRFVALNRQEKGRIFYMMSEIKQQPKVDMGAAMLVDAVLQTCCALQNYGPQLIYKDENGVISDKLYEDRVTELFREMFNLAFGNSFGFTVHDQEKRGSTGLELHGSKSPGEIDLSVYYNGTCNEIMEAFVLTDDTSNSIFKDHLKKAIGNNISHQPLTFMLLYGNAKDSTHARKKYWDYLKDRMNLDFAGTILEKSELLDIEKAQYYLESFNKKFHGLYFLRQRIELKEGKVQEILHIFLDLAKNAEGKIRRK